MTFELSPDEARLLLEHMKIYLRHVDTELSRTDRYQLQHALAREERTLESIVERLSQVLAGAAGQSRAAPDR